MHGQTDLGLHELNTDQRNTGTFNKLFAPHPGGGSARRDKRCGREPSDQFVAPGTEAQPVPMTPDQPAHHVATIGGSVANPTPAIKRRQVENLEEQNQRDDKAMRPEMCGQHGVYTKAGGEKGSVSVQRSLSIPAAVSSPRPSPPAYSRVPQAWTVLFPSSNPGARSVVAACKFSWCKVSGCKSLCARS